MAQYSVPPWIPGAPDAASQFLGGLRAGSEIAAQQAQLKQEANLTQLKLTLQEQENQRQNALEQQRMAQQKAYQTAQLGLQQQELQQAQQLNQIKVQQAARTFQAQQSFQQWLQANPDKDPAEGILKFFPGTDASFGGAGQLAMALSRERASLKPPEFGEAQVGGQKYPYALTRSPTGGYAFHQLRAAGAQDPLERQMIMEEVRSMENDRKEMRKELLEDPARALEGRDVSKLSPEEKGRYDAYQQKKADFNQLTADIAALRQGREIGIRAPRTEAPGAPTGGAQFRFNPQSGKIEPAVGGETEPPAPYPVPAGGMLPPQPQSLFNAPATAGIARPFQMPKLSQMNPVSTTLAGARNFATGVPWLARGAGQMAQQGATNMLSVPQWIIDRWKQEVGQPQTQP